MISKFFKAKQWLYLMPTALIACQTTAIAEPLPAVLKVSDEGSMQILKTTVAKAMNTRSVEFGRTDLTQSSSFSAIPTRLSLPSGAPQNQAANFAIPTQFSLMMDGNACYLMQNGSDEKIPLKGIACQPMLTLN